MGKKWLIFVSFIVGLYSATWFIALNMVSGDLNKKYANKYIKTSDKSEYFVKFAKIQPSGFPFKWAVKISGWTEEGAGNITTCTSDIIVGYDLLMQRAFANYSGDIISKYKPENSGFGSKITTDDYSFIIKLPLSIDLVKAIMSAEDKFEVINFVNGLELSSKNTKIFDLVDNKKIYDDSYKSVNFSFNKPTYYTSLGEMLKNVPNQLKINYSIKVNSSSYERKLAPPSLISGIIFPFVFTGEGSVYVKTGSKTIDGVAKDLEVQFVKNKLSSSLYDANLDALYKTSMQGQDINMHVTVDSGFNLKPGFFNSVFSAMQYIANSIPKYSPMYKTRDELIYIIANKDKYNLSALEGRRYDCKADLDIINTKGSIYAKLHNLSVYTGNTGIKLVSDNHFKNPKVWSSNGAAKISNYKQVIDITLGNFYLTGKYKTLSPQARKLYINVAKDFLKTISDKQTSGPNDANFNYAVDSTKLGEAKFGNINFGKLETLYQTTLYNQALEALKKDGTLKEELKKLLPQLPIANDVIKQVIDKPKDIQKTIEKEVLKKLFK